MRKLVSFLIFINLLVFPAMSNPKEKIPSSQRTKINFWYSVPAEYNQYLEKLIEKYNEEFRYHEVIAKNFESPESLRNALKNKSVLPEVALIDARWQRELISSGSIEPVEDLMNNAGSTLKVVLKMDTFPVLWENCTFEDKIQTLPFYVNNQALIYNTRLFSEKKIKTPPVTWTELVKCSKLFSNASIGQFGLYIPVKSNQIDLAAYFQVLLWQSGTDLSDASGNFSLRDSKALSTLIYLSDIVSKHKSAYAGENKGNKNYAMMIGNIEDYLKLKRTDSSVAVAPLPKDKVGANQMILSTFAVIKKPNSDKRKSWNLIYWLTEFPQEGYWALNTPYLPANKQVTLSPEYYGYLQTYPDLRVYIAQLKNSRISFHDDEVMMLLGNKIYQVLENKVKTEDAIRQVTAEVENRLNSQINSPKDNY